MFRKLFRLAILPDAPLGRWSRTTEKMNAIKIFWANVDHCGTCSAETVDKPADAKNPTPTSQSPPVVKEIR